MDTSCIITRTRTQTPIELHLFVRVSDSAFCVKSSLSNESATEVMNRESEVCEGNDIRKREVV
jgi:hypothetical protein